MCGLQSCDGLRRGTSTNLELTCIVDIKLKIQIYFNVYLYLLFLLVKKEPDRKNCNPLFQHFLIIHADKIHSSYTENIILFMIDRRSLHLHFVFSTLLKLDDYTFNIHGQQSYVIIMRNNREITSVRSYLST